MFNSGIRSSWLATSCQLPCRTPSSPRLSPKASASSVSTSATDVESRILLASSTGRLDLSECGLTEVPSQVFQLEDLVDLSLAGNNIHWLSDDIHNLRNLRRLGLAGNSLQVLPKGIGKLTNLEGLWVHGNKLQNIPDEIGELGQLRTLALAGNKLTFLPETIRELTNVQILSLAGNLLQQIPSGIGCMRKLRVLAVYGNNLSRIPESLARLSSLEDLWLQGNGLEDLPSELSCLKSLKQLSLADNLLSALPESISHMQALEILWIYGNRLQQIPRSIGDLPRLAHLWMEGNPLDARSLLDALPGLTHLKSVGVSCEVGCEGISEKLVSFSKIGGSGAAAARGGYFKLQSEGDCKLVVVAFGSAPCVPNWGGLLKRVKMSLNSSEVVSSFDILYVVDSCRSWYTHDGFERDVDKIGQTDAQDPVDGPNELKPGRYYRCELELALKDYDRVLMLGDSMGASAALLFSDLATSVIAFCPQVDLTTSSIRPGVDEAWHRRYKDAILDSVLSSGARITVHCGSWQHDLEQAKLLPFTRVELVEHGVNDHRLAKELDSSGDLVSIVQLRILEEMSLSTKTG